MAVAEEVRKAPVYVDLDGTLAATDLLWESIFRLVSQRPSDALRLLGWLRLGRAGFKRRLAARVRVDVGALPFRKEVLAYLHEARAAGRRIVLATASDELIAAAVAEHLGIFDAVLASDGELNLGGARKLAAIRDHAQGDEFEYVGDSARDVPIWRDCAWATLVAPSRATRKSVSGLGIPHQVLVTSSPLWRAAWQALRPHQWSKNALLFVPLFLAHQALDAARLGATVLAAITFCAVASATYVLNDLLDAEADRRHPGKRHRPIAAGSLPIPWGVGLAAALGTGGLALSALLLPPVSTGMLVVYALLTTVYSLWLKERLVFDVLLLAGLYTHRVLAGAMAAQVTVSHWLLAFSMFFFLGLAFVKRYTELLAAGTRERESLDRRAYQTQDADLVSMMGLSSGYLSVLVLGLYVSSEKVTRLYPKPELLWLVSPIMLFWITRVWFLARRGELHEDPVLFALRDRTSWVAGALVILVGGAAGW